ncbi:MAG: hypothetical protein P1P87_12080 [Trueperaceae bacterium]|nr:hypothetical protein [Trueperaceae bacterium]
MSDAVWPRLAAPFSLDAVAWVAVEVADAGDEVRVVPRVRASAVRERFDAVVGVAGWQVAYAPFDGGAVACHLTASGVTKGVVVPAALAGGASATADVALAAAAELFGARPPVAADASAWVACDPETLAPLHPPAHGDVASGGVGAVPTEGPARRPEASESLGGAATPSAAAPAMAPAPSSTAPAALTTSDAVGASDAVAVKPTGQQMIDRLVERLKDEGQGLAAARLLVRYGGYGKDPDAARELYAQLRELLRSAPVVAGGGDGA